MMVERHYDDEALIALMEADRVRVDAHVPSCPVCSGKLRSFETIASALHEHDVWDTREVRTQPVPSTIANLRAFADRMAFEDAQAEAIVAELLAGPREEWMPRLLQHPEWRTAGVVRKLVADLYATVGNMPPDALEMTALSTMIADHLDVAEFPSDTVSRLRGSAWRDRAFALYYVGLISESLAAADIAERHFGECTVDEYDRARLAVVRVLALREKESVAAAIEAARASVSTFRRFEDAARLASASLAEAHMLYTLGEFETARELLEPLEVSLRRTEETYTHALVLGNLGYCYGKLSRIDDALRHIDAAAALFDSIGVRTESVRLRWAVADILLNAGRHDEARARLEQLKTEFEELGMPSEMALVSLQIAEVLLALGVYDAVESICREAMTVFQTSGIPHGARALTALAYMQEAAQLRTATPKLVRHVREYIGRLPQDGELLFAPPPPEHDLPRQG